MSIELLSRPAVQPWSPSIGSPPPESAEVRRAGRLESQKGARKLDRPPRKHGGRAALRGISRHLDCILVARDRSGQTIDVVTGRGPLRVAQLVRHLLPKLAPQALLVTDANYLGWHWALDGGRITSVEQLLRIAFRVINTMTAPLFCLRGLVRTGCSTSITRFDNEPLPRRPPPAIMPALGGCSSAG